MAGVFDTIAKRLRQVAFSFKEKPTTKVDDYVLEHFLLYHGLVGSSPENQRSYKDVRRDVFEALESASSLQLGIAMKVQPLWWEDKLKTIFAEAPFSKNAPKLLLPDLEDNAWPNQSDPLGHPEWMVRANAANMLSHLKVTQADERMSRALNDTADNGTAAFCHIAYALGRLGTERAKEALKAHLHADEPWFRVDVAGALAASNREDVYELLAEALFSDHALQDYTSVAIAKSRKPTVFLNSSSASVQDAGCALVIGLLQSSKQTFIADLISELDLPSLMPLIENLVNKAPNPIRIHTQLLLSEWIAKANQFSPEFKTTQNAETIRDQYKNEKTEKLVHSFLHPSSDKDYWARANQRHAIQLIGQLQLQSQLPDLLNMLEKKSAPLDLIVQALEDLGDVSASTPLVVLVDQLVDVKDRASKAPSKNPVAEEKEFESKLYWQILKALGNLPAPNSITLLAAATDDFAPDKREQALASLVSAYEQNHSLMSKTTINEIFKKALVDQAAGVRVVALDGVARLNAIDLLEQVLDNFEAREISVSKQAKQTVSALSRQGHEGQVEQALQAKLKRETDEFKRRKIQEFIQNEKP